MLGNIGALQKYQFGDGNEGKKNCLSSYFDKDCVWARFQNSCIQEMKVIAMLTWSVRILSNILYFLEESKVKIRTQKILIS